MKQRRIWIKRRDKVRQRYWVGREPRKTYGSIKPLSDKETRSYYFHRLSQQQPFDPKKLPPAPPYISFEDNPNEREIFKNKIKSRVLGDRDVSFGDREITTYKTKGDQFVTIVEDVFSKPGTEPYPHLKGYLSDTEKEAINIHSTLENLPQIVLKPKKNYGSKWKDRLRHDTSIKRLEEEMDETQKKRMDLQIKKNKLDFAQYKLRSPDSPLWVDDIDPFTMDDKEIERRISFIEKPFFVREKEKWQDRPEFKKWMEDENVLWGEKPAKEARELVDFYKSLDSTETELERKQEELFNKLQDKKKAQSEEEELKSL